MRTTFGSNTVTRSAYASAREERGHKKPMQITDIKIRKLFDDGPMKAIVSVTFDNALAVHDIKVIYAHDRTFIVMPSRKNPDGTYRDIVHPINASFRASLEGAVLDAYRAAEIEAKEHPENAENAGEGDPEGAAFVG